MSKPTVTPTLEQRIVAALANTNAGSAELAALIAETEAAAQASVETAEAERVKSLDLVQCPDPAQAQQALAAAELTCDRLRAVLPKLREKLTAALEAEHHARWLNDYHSVKRQVDEAVTLFNSYREHSEAIAQMFAVAVEMDREVSRINIAAPDGENRRLQPVELAARGLDRFTRDNPSLAANCELRNWEDSGRKLWPVQSSGSFAADFAVPYHPGPRWAEPAVQAQRRAEVEKSQRELGEYYADATEQQEARQNREERERALTLKR